MGRARRAGRQRKDSGGSKREIKPTVDMAQSWVASLPLLHTSTLDSCKHYNGDMNALLKEAWAVTEPWR